MQITTLKYNLSGDIIFGKYLPSGENAIQIISETDGLVAVASVNLHAWGERPSGPDEVWIKTWSENEGMERALINAGVIEKTFVSEAFGGYANSCRAVLAKLTPAAIAVRDAQEKESV